MLDTNRAPTVREGSRSEFHPTAAVLSCRQKPVHEWRNLLLMEGQQTPPSRSGLGFEFPDGLTASVGMAPAMFARHASYSLKLINWLNVRQMRWPRVCGAVWILARPRSPIRSSPSVLSSGAFA